MLQSTFTLRNTGTVFPWFSQVWRQSTTLWWGSEQLFPSQYVTGFILLTVCVCVCVCVSLPWCISHVGHTAGWWAPWWGRWQTAPQGCRAHTQRGPSLTETLAEDQYHDMFLCEQKGNLQLLFKNTQCPNQETSLQKLWPGEPLIGLIS